MWNTALSISWGSGVRVAVDTSSINLEKLSGIAWDWTTLLVLPHSSVVIFAFLTSTIFSDDFSLSWNTWSTWSLVVESTCVWFAIFTDTSRKNSLSVMASWCNTLSAVWRWSCEWWALFQKTIGENFLLWSTSVLFTTSSILWSSLEWWAVLALTIYQKSLSHCAWIWSAESACHISSGPIWAFVEFSILFQEVGSLWFAFWQVASSITWFSFLEWIAWSTSTILSNYFVGLWSTWEALSILALLLNTSTSSVVRAFWASSILHQLFSHLTEIWPTLLLTLLSSSITVIELISLASSVTWACKTISIFFKALSGRWGTLSTSSTAFKSQGAWFLENWASAASTILSDNISCSTVWIVAWSLSWNSNHAWFTWKACSCQWVVFSVRAWVFDTFGSWQIWSWVFSTFCACAIKSVSNTI